MGLCQNCEVHPKSLLSNFWGALHLDTSGLMTKHVIFKPIVLLPKTYHFYLKNDRFLT